MSLNAWESDIVQRGVIALEAIVSGADTGRCDECRFGVNDTKRHAGELMGRMAWREGVACRRFPADPFPLMRAGDWCGEFRKR